MRTVDAPAPPEFDDAFRARLHDLMVWRRDVRRFSPDPIDDAALGRLIEAARLAPSVGLSQPWRFVLVDEPARRAAILESYRRSNREALAAYDGGDAALYARLKLAGLEEAPRQLAVFADLAGRQGRGLGRRTMPETVQYSVVAAICNLWLAARAEGVGVGWISILDPDAVRGALDVPDAWDLVGYFCIGRASQADDTPELEREGWERRQATDRFIVRR